MITTHLQPYIDNKIKFTPQLFHKFFFLPFGLQTTQIHLNEFSEKDFQNFKTLIEKKYKNIVTYDEALNLLSNKIIDKILNKFINFVLLIKRKIV